MSKPSHAKIAAARGRVVDWFERQAWKPFRFQRQAWNAYLDGESGLVHASTGTGKTLAAWLGPVIEGLAEQENKLMSKPKSASKSQTASKAKTLRRHTPPLRVLWITPLRALASDTLQSLQKPVDDLELRWSIESRTSDTSSTVRNRQRTKLPTVLVTTPESLSVLLSRNDAREQLNQLRCVVVDEWHELLASKRGVQTELGLARLRRWNPPLRTWGLSATLGNTEQAMDILLGSRATPRSSNNEAAERDSAQDHSRSQRLITGVRSKKVVVETLIPDSIERFPWAGHLGLKSTQSVVKSIDEVQSTLVFANTRSQVELWYQSILSARPDWAGQIALHHGSLDRDTRDWVEDQLRVGKLKCVVCTSSLDLGVDFSPVDRVFQIGSPKGVGRLVQRAGRSGHSPGRTSRVICVPTHAFELVEIAAAREAIDAGYIERREPVSEPLDVLTQHAVTVAVGGGFQSEELLQEAKTTHCYRELDDDQWQWMLKFITTGGDALKAYPDYHKVDVNDDGTHSVENRQVARRHRLSIGTIVGDGALTVQFIKGPRLGTIEEAFLAKINPGDQFYFAGRLVELVRVQDSKVWVRKAKKSGKVTVPRWMGARMPLSTELSAAVQRKLDDAAQGQFDGPEMKAVQPLLELQALWSRVPRLGELLIERVRSREGHHLFVYPFAGRLVHEGLSSLFAFRLSQLTPISFSISVDDYGFELLSPDQAPLAEAIDQGLFLADDLEVDIGNSVNAVEMAKRQFREVAHIAGLVFNGYPNERRTARQLQASTGLLYDVFRNFDPDNRLLQQATREVLEQQFEQNRLLETLSRMRQSQMIVRDLKRFSPMSFPLMVSRLRARLSSEKLADRVRRMQEQLEKAANKS